MKRIVRSITLLTTLAAAPAWAQFNPLPLTPGSFTADVVVEATAPKPLMDYTTATMDGGTNNNSETWFETGFDITRPDTGIPLANSTFVAQSDPNRTFKMPPSYEVANALFLTVNGSPTATITLSTPTAAATLSLLGSGSGGDTTLNYTVHHQGGGTQAGTVFVQDWFNRATTIAMVANGRVNKDSGQTGERYTGNPRLHYVDIILNDVVNPVTSIELTTTSGNRVALFGVSASTDNTLFTPVDITGFNRDVVVEKTGPISSLYTKCNVIMDSGATNVTGNTWYEVGFNKAALTTGLPAAGSSVSGGNMTFTMPPTYTTNNCVYIGNYAGYTTGTLTLSAPANYTGLAFLNSSGNGSVTINVTVYHADSSSEFFSFNSLDWFNGANPFYTTAGRFNPASLALNDVGSTNPRLYTNTVTLANTTSPVTSIQFDFGGSANNGRTMIFAVAGQTTGGGSFSAVPVTGYTADGVVEASAFRFPGANFAHTTATMDGGTNFTGGPNNLNTWYERGYYRYRPDTGLPPAGSIITSLNLPDHHYQMPATYVGNNAIFVDSFFTNANLTPQTPTTYSALSFLSTCANGTVTNQVIMQYQDGTSETNTFISRDWFNNTPYAFTSRGRVDVNRQTVNAVGSDNPRLYEAQFALANTASPVTNMVLKFLGGSAANSRMFVFAVSASAGDVPPIISSVSITPAVTFEGSNVVFNAILTGGTEPISYQWQKGTNGVYVNVNNGGNITGATTTNMTITATINDIADYRLIASNVQGSVPSGIVTLQRVLSSLPDVTAPGDVAVITAGTTPDGENVARASDNTTSKYLNFGNPSGTPFTGPVGFIIRPASGNTIVSALRFYTANDAEERDPADYLLEGSLDGGNYTTIASGALALPGGRNAADLALNPLTQNMQEVRFVNAAGYPYYRLTFNNVKNNAAANSVQVGEIEFLGVPNPNSPPFFTVVPANVTVNEGTTATFTSLATGPGAITYQWYDVTSGDPGVAMGGQTAANLTLTSVTSAQSGNRYRVVATNPYGSVTNPATTLPAAELTVNSGPVSFAQDLPAETLTYAGRTLNLAAVVSGTAPSYQWQSNGVNLVNGGRISGATSNVLSIANVQLTDAAQYQLQASNSFGGPVSSIPTTVSVITTPTFLGNGFGWHFINGGNDQMYFLSPDELVLTTAGSQQRAAWFTIPMQIDAFKASFRYQDVTVGGADGFAFVVQNSAQGTNAIGGGGGGIGYSTIPSSAALLFNIFGTPGISFRTNGAAPAPFTATSLNFADGNPIDMELNYNGAVLSLTMSNTVTAATFTTNLTVGSLASAVGTNVAYVGITAATGGIAAEQRISNFRYVPVPSATATVVGANLLLSWPGTIGGYGVAASPSVIGTYTNVPGFIGQTNGLNQKSVPMPAGNGFFRLVLPLP